MPSTRLRLVVGTRAVGSAVLALLSRLLLVVLHVISTARLSRVMQHAMPPVGAAAADRGWLSGCMLALASFGVDRR
jgi:hypothetical protein